MAVAEFAAQSRMQDRGLRGWLDQVDRLGELRKAEEASSRAPSR